MAYEVYIFAAISVILVGVILVLSRPRDSTGVKEGFNSRMLDYIEDSASSKTPENFDQRTDVDGRVYNVVKKLPNHEDAAGVLATVHGKNLKLIKHLQNKYPNDPRTKRLVRLYRRESLKEVDPFNIHGETSYTVGKGKELGLCMRQKSGRTPFVPINDLMFVDIHELTHIATKSLQHPPEFWVNNRWLLRRAEEVGLMHADNYAAAPKPYCGIELVDNIS